MVSVTAPHRQIVKTGFYGEEQMDRKRKTQNVPVFEL